MPIYPIRDKKTGKTFEMKWDKPNPPTEVDVDNYQWEQENSLQGKAGKFLGDHPVARRFLFGPNEEDLGGRKLATPGWGEESLLPEAKHGDNEGWPEYLAKGAYNQLIRPMGTGSGILGTSKLGKIPDIIPAERPSIRPTPRPQLALPDIDVPQQGALPPGPPTRLGLPPAPRTFYGGARTMSENLSDIGQEGLTPAEATQDALIPNRYKPTPSPKRNFDVIGRNQLNPTRIVDGEIIPSRGLDDISATVEGSPAPLPRSEGTLGSRTNPKAVSKPTPKSTVSSPNPFSKASDGDVQFLAGTGDEAAIEEAAARPALSKFVKNVGGKLSWMYKDEGGMAGSRSSGVPRPEPLNLGRRGVTSQNEPIPPSDSFDKGIPNTYTPKFDHKEFISSLKDSIKNSKLMSDEEGAIKFFGASNKQDPLPLEFKKWVWARQASNLEPTPQLASLRKSQADVNFWAYLQKNGLTMPGSKGFTKFTSQAHPVLQKSIKNYLAKPSEEVKWLADKASLAKNLALSSGVPGTGINAHGFNILARTVIGNPKEALRTGKYLLNPKSAGRDLQAMMPTAKFAVRNGLTLTTEGHQMGVVGSTNLAGKLGQGFLKLQGKLFEDPLFQNIIPSIKLKHFNDMHLDLVKGGMGSEAAAREAADFTNKLYGGINWESMGRSREMQNFGRMLILAPDWLETNYQLGKGLGKSLLDPKSPQGKAYARIASGMVGSYMAADVVNQALSGHNMWENAPGHALDIEYGKSGDKIRWIRPFGTAADFMRLPFDAASAALKGDLSTTGKIIKNRLSIPASTFGNLVISNEDDMGRPITGKDMYGRPIPVKQQLGGVASEMSDLVLPPYARSAIDYGTGRSNAEQATVGALELPLRYSKGSSSRRTRSR